MSKKTENIVSSVFTARRYASAVLAVVVSPSGGAENGKPEVGRPENGRPKVIRDIKLADL